MASTNTPNCKPHLPSARRLSQVYVEIPPSPLSRSASSNILPHVQALTDPSRKANTPSQHKGTTSHNAGTSVVQGSSTSRKRKLSSSASMVFVEIDSPAFVKKAKKARVSGAKSTTSDATSNAAKKPKQDAKNATSNASEEFPDGFFYCHQCFKKRDCNKEIRCTMKDDAAKDKRCKVRLCIACLKNRYGEDAHDIKACGANPKEKEKHVPGENYTFECPRCRGICNCARCRKAQGLEPTGNLTNAARRNGLDNGAAGILKNDPKASGIRPGQGTQTVPPAKKPKDVTDASKPKPKRKPAKKPLPRVKWEKAPTHLSLDGAEARFMIREFVVRFAPLMDIARSHLDELEEIRGHRSRWHVGSDEEEDEQLAPWISEPAVKCVVQGLLGLFQMQIFKNALKETRSVGANLSKLWAVLSDLRDALEAADYPHLSLPDPLPLPYSTTARETRSGGITIAASSQLIPVLAALIAGALHTGTVRTELEDGVRENKERVREKAEAWKRENERWETERPALADQEAQLKTRRAAHRDALHAHEMALRVALSAGAPRTGPIGRDADGRVYWALSAGALQREAALDFLAASAGEKVPRRPSRKGKLVPGVEDRAEMRRWSWFVAVWGKRPPLADGEARKAASEDSEDEDEDEERWWGFWEPEEVRKLADWIAITSGLDDEPAEGETTAARSSLSNSSKKSASVRAESPLTDVSSSSDEEDDVDMDMPTSTADLRALVKHLKENASLLEWRTRLAEVDEHAKGKGKIEAKDFYAA
ncbi:hypothetical protein PLICRDRAFT_155104 [Plicaturopsis crispa FD-325 SS-3]|nr:hypothetical protein PLICRDRAFT_155104 [Plicaturopsis crispa FD-325 SS-3]